MTYMATTKAILAQVGHYGFDKLDPETRAQFAERVRADIDRHQRVLDEFEQTNFVEGASALSAEIFQARELLKRLSQ